MPTLPEFTLSEILLTDDTGVLARGERNGQTVLVRMPQEDYPAPEELARLKYGYELSAKLQAPGDVKVLDLLRHGNSAILVMEDFGGEPLRRLQAQVHASPRLALEIGLRTAKVLGELHQRHIIHKNINPSTLLVHPRTGEVRLSNFDIASRLSSESPGFTTPDKLEGLLTYISPEQTGRMNRTVDHRTDLYSLGVTLYELLTGQPPFQTSDTMALVYSHLAVEPIPPHQLRPDLPPPLSAVVMKLLAKNADDRYQSAYGLSMDLNHCLEQLGSNGTIADFRPGQHDTSATFHLSQKLYGREQESAQLGAVFERVSQEGRSELLLVVGYSGVGKSSLVNEMHRPLVRQRGYYGVGKYDQLQNAPYGAWVQAFAGLTQQLLSESEERLSEWRQRLQEALGANGRVVTELVPQLELILGPQPPVPALGPNETQSRFNLVFQQLVSVFASREHPLILCLDDLQWADAASMVLLQRILSDPSIRHVLVIGAYRDNEVRAGHALLATLDELRKQSAAVTELLLRPLALEDVRQLLADTFNRPVDAEVEALAQLVFQKTQGNPFFLSQFVLSLNARGLITFDPGQGRWRWELAQLRGEAITDNVAILMAERIASLPQATQEALKRAACIGNRFSLATISVISERSPGEMADALWEAVRLGLLLPIGNAYKYVLGLAPEDAPASYSEVRYEFLHDRVQEAAYSLMSEEARKQLHLRIGRLLLDNTPEAQREAMIFDLVNQLNRAVELLERREEREELARFNLLAGSRAKASSAHSAALEYLRMGTTLLSEDSWDRQHGLALALHRHLSECCFLVGQSEEAERGFQLVLQRARSPEQKHDIYHLMLELYVSRGQYQQMLRPTLEGLRVLEIEVPEAPEAMAAAAREQERLKANLAGRPIDSLVELPEAREPLERARILFFSQVLSYAGTVHPQLFSLLAPMAMNRAVEKGHAPGSATTYVMYAMNVGIATGDYARAHEYGRLALALVEKLGGPGELALVQFLFAAFPNPWCRPTETSVRMLEQSFQGCVANGMLQVWAPYASMQLGILAQLGKEELETQLGRLQRHVEFYLRSGEQLLWAIYQVRVSQNCILRLMHGDQAVDDPAWHPEAALLEKMDNPNMGVIAHAAWMRVAFLLEDHERALNSMLLVESRIHQAFGMTLQVEFQLYQGLLMAALHPKATTEEKARYEQVIAANIEKLRGYSGLCAENFQHKYLLLAAERARLSGQDAEAMALYDQAIEASVAAELCQDEALAHELAARFYLARGSKRVARTYLEGARHAYARWGARAKIAALDRRYPELLRPGAPGTRASGASVEGLDLITVLKASQAISEEIVLDELLQKLMRIILENAGAQSGVLLLKGDNPLVVEARLAENGTTQVQVHGSAQEILVDLPMTLLRYVERTGERVVLGEATREGRFQSDTYITRQRPRSVLCIQVRKQRQPMGTLYMENNLVAGAFTPERCRVLELLSAQAAISLENARLYETLDQRVRERTRELHASNEELSQTLQQLKQAQAQLVLKEKLASLGALTSGIAHELKNPLNFIKNFGFLSIDLAQELQEKLDGLRDQVGPQSMGDLEELTTTLKDNAAHISAHGNRADAIVSSMLALSRMGGRGQYEEQDPHALVDQFINMAYQEIRMVSPSFEVNIERSFDAKLRPLEVMPQALGRALLNIVNNACYALEERRKKGEAGFSPLLTVSTRDLGGAIEIRLRDNGTGIPESIRDKVFNPFFTSKPPGKGTGLGLAISYDIIVQGHGGTIEFTSEEGVFTEFVITLPRRVSSAGSAMDEVA